jgi:hypothetical protein
MFFIHAMDLNALYESELVGYHIANVALSTLEKKTFIQPPNNFEGHQKINFLQNLALNKMQACSTKTQVL